VTGTRTPSLADLADLGLLAALWGASFLFMRVAAPEFGPVALAFGRVALAAAVLLPLALARREGAAIRTHWRALAFVGLANSALPFLFIAAAMLVLTTGSAAILNATAPLMAALVGVLWLGERLPPLRWAGLAIALAGVALLAADKVGLKGGTGWITPAVGVALSLAATVLYGIAAHATRRWLQGVAPVAVAAGSQAAAALWLLPAAMLAWPTAMPSTGAWAALAALAVGCTAVAYLLYFRLVARAGAGQAIAVTYLVPVFAALWGAIWLAEAVTLPMAVAGAVVLAGTALATGVLPRPRRNALSR
jgi:drug/metabolite transporter (DMT)-like permease